MNPIQIKFKLISPHAKLPQMSSEHAAAYDVFTPTRVCLSHGRQKIPLGFIMEMPVFMKANIRTRSGYATKGLLAYDVHGHGVRLDADVLYGLIDPDYRGEIGVTLDVHDKRLFSNTYYLSLHQEIAQMEFEMIPDVTLVESDDLSETERGTRGFGQMNNE